MAVSRMANRFEAIPFPEYVYREYPKYVTAMVNGKEKRVIVHSAGEEREVLSEGKNTPETVTVSTKTLPQEPSMSTGAGLSQPIGSDDVMVDEREALLQRARALKVENPEQYNTARLRKIVEKVA